MNNHETTEQLVSTRWDVNDNNGNESDTVALITTVRFVFMMVVVMVTAVMISTMHIMVTVVMV